LFALLVFLILAIELSVLLLFTASGYLLGMFKLSNQNSRELKLCFEISNTEFAKGFSIKTIEIEIQEDSLSTNPKWLKNSLKLRQRNKTDVLSYLSFFFLRLLVTTWVCSNFQTFDSRFVALIKTVIVCLIAPSNVTSLSGLSMFDCPFQCNQFLWIVYV
jgi:hypothetical protein